MKVKELIRQLKKVPQNLRVDTAMHDNAEYESAGNVCSVLHFKKSDYKEDTQFMSKEDIGMFNDMPDECIILHC